MLWKCNKCAKELNIRSTRVFCSCGNIVDFAVSPVVHSQVEVTEDWRKLRTPDWEVTHRLSRCEGCKHHSSQNHKRCSLVDLGCHNTFDATLRRTDGRCPLDKWTEYIVPWYTTTDLIQGAVQLIPRLPKDTDAIIGIPRSGLIPATTIAATTHKSLYTIVDRQLVRVSGGVRSQNLEHNGGSFALVEDSVGKGNQLNFLEATQIIPTNVFRAAVFVTSEGATRVNCFHRIQDAVHLFEWNFFNAPQVALCALDLDGLLSPDVPPELCDSGPLEEDYFKHVQPLQLPQNPLYKTKAIVTARLEKFRDVTTDWLQRHKVQYQELIMWDNDQSRTLTNVASWKRNVCRYLDVSFYVESDLQLTQELRRRHLRVLNIEEGCLR